MNSWNSYPKVWNMGHPQARDLFSDIVVVQEKVDGSQFSFGVIDGELKIKSKGAIIQAEAPPNLFKEAVETVLRLQPLLNPGWTYRGEVLSRPKHNVLAYDRVPKGNIILFDISVEYEGFAAVDVVEAEARCLGLEMVPTVFVGNIACAEELFKLMDAVSVLGGQKIEGLVIKNYYRHGIDGKNLMGKIVSSAFKEVHKGEWRANNPTNGDIITVIADKLTSPARWQKAVQHVREAGTLTDSPKDIGPLLGEIVNDVKAEEEERIKEALFKYAWKIISRRITHGFPEWYKNELVNKQFEMNAPGMTDLMVPPETLDAFMVENPLPDPNVTIHIDTAFPLDSYAAGAALMPEKEEE